MTLSTKKVDKSLASLRTVEELFTEAFPPDELWPLTQLEQLAERDDVDFLAYYDGDELCGASYSVMTDCMTYVLYLAIVDNQRSKGFGSRILSHIKDSSGEKPVSLDVEPVAQGADNYAQRVNRMAFYRRNGFGETGYEVVEDGKAYPILSTSEHISPADLQDVFQSSLGGLFDANVRKVEWTTDGSRMRLALADEEDLPLAMAMIDAGKRFLAESGVDQWQNGYPDQACIEADIKGRKGYFVEGDGEKLGYLCVDFDGEPAYDQIDGAWDTDDDYVVVHRLSFSPAARGKGLSTGVFRLVEDLARSLGVHSFRVDTDEDNMAMRHALAKSGFTYRGTIRFDNSDKIAFDKRI